MKVQLQVLGCGDAFGSGGRSNTCYLVNSENINFLVDCGGSALITMKKNGKSSNDIDAIFITHFHGDHIGGIPYILCEAKNLVKRKKPLKIIGPKGIKQRVEKITELFYSGTIDNLPFELSFEEINENRKLNISGMDVEYYEVNHSPDSFPHGIRFKIENKVIGFSGDTEWTPSLNLIAQNADLFICECNFYKKGNKSHLDYETLKEKRKELSCKRIILTHLGEEILENISQVDLEIAEEGKIYAI
jgi:ribonuclease BN (tRNA processing enzyme)